MVVVATSWSESSEIHVAIIKNVRAREIIGSAVVMNLGDVRREADEIVEAARREASLACRRFNSFLNAGDCSRPTGSQAVSACWALHECSAEEVLGRTSRPLEGQRPSLASASSWDD